MKTRGPRVWAIVELKKYVLTTNPYDDFGELFCIIVMADPANDDEKKVWIEKHVIDNQKFPVYKVAKDINGNANMHPNIQIYDLVL